MVSKIVQTIYYGEWVDFLSKRPAFLLSKVLSLRRKKNTGRTTIGLNEDISGL